MIHVPCTAQPLCRLPAPGAWLWLVRPDTGEAAAAIGIVLLHHLPALLVTLGLSLAFPMLGLTLLAVIMLDLLVLSALPPLKRLVN